MNKVLTISLNGTAYQLEEAGYERLRSYLDDARAKLSGDPDIEEILRDLEAAIAEKLSARMSMRKNVADLADVLSVLAEMGPVEGEKGEGATSTAGTAPKKLYRLPGNEMVFGVCAGLAAYFDMDVTLVRIIFVVLTIFTGGGFLLAYFVMMLLIPTATTPAERSAAYGAVPITAQELIDRAKQEYQKWDKGQWKARKAEMKRQWREQKNAWRHQGRAWQNYGYPRGPSLIGELIQLLIFALIIWALYTYVPQTQPFFNAIWRDLQAAWAWLSAKLAH